MTGVQKDVLVNFMEAHSDLQKGKFGSNFSHKKANLLWDQVAMRSIK